MSDSETNAARVENSTHNPSSQSGPGKTVYLWAGIFLCAAACIWLYVYKPPAQVRLVVNTTRVDFNSSASDLEKLIKACDTKSIQISSAVRLTLGHGSISVQAQPPIQAQDAFLDMPDPNSPVTISGPPITRIQFQNESKYRVSLGWLESSPDVVQVAFRPAETVFLAPFKDMRIACDYCSLRGLRHADLRGPLAFRFTSDETQGHEVSVALRDNRFKGTLSLSSVRAFNQRDIPIQDAPRFERAEGDQIRSAILGGEIIVTGVDGAIEHKLGPSATIAVSGIKDLRIDEIRIENSLMVTVSGEVNGLMISGANVLPTMMHAKWGFLAEMITAIATVCLVFATLLPHILPRGFRT